MGKEFYFETDDRLDRKKYADFLKTLLEHCDEYRREDSDGAYVIAIDSPWGTGKTRFAKMLRNYLEDRTKKMGDDSAPGENASFNAIYYNSWDTDFSDDALQPLIHSITKAPEFKSIEFNEAGKEIFEKFKRSAVAVAKVVGFAMIHHFFGETAADIAKTLDDSTSEKTPNPLEEYQSKLDLLQGFKDSLKELIALTKKKKLVIIVDELDRCRPTYAIQTLEIVKHLFDVEDIVFIFALDIKQLSCSVKTVYGQEMDAAGYLCRFFDYIGRIPKPDVLEFIQYKLLEIQYYRKNPDHYYKNNAEYIKRLAEVFSFSLRDINTILNVYKAVVSVFLYKYVDYTKHQIYLYLLALKYKDSESYNRIFKISPDIPSQTQNISTKYVINKYSDFQIFIEALRDDALLRNASLELNIVGKKMDKKSCKISSADFSKYEKSGFYAVIFRNEPGGEDYFLTSDMRSEFSWGHILFLEDICKWEKIKDMTLAEYMYCQLEMFSFAFPADETPPEA